VRWDELNAKPLCAKCHFWWHQNPVDAAEWLKTIRTPEELSILRDRANAIKKWTVNELQTLFIALTEKVRSLE
jgi:hypothetical protein